MAGITMDIVKKTTLRMHLNLGGLLESHRRARIIITT